MIDTFPPELEKYRITDGVMGSDESYGRRGAFVFPGDQFADMTYGKVRCVVDDGREETDPTGWEHVSVSCIFGSKQATPSWEVMAKVKDLFWDDDERVVQFHPPKDEYVNFHEHVLHLWRPVDDEMPSPPPRLVGPYRQHPSNPTDT